MLTASARPDPNAPFARAEITIRGLPAAPTSPAFQLRRSNADYIEPNLDLTGWTRSDVVLLPLDAWWDGADGSFHLLISGLLCQYIDPGPLKLRLPEPGGAEIDLFWPEDISVYDDGTLAAQARVLADTVRVIGPAPTSPPPQEPESSPPPAEPPPQPSPWTAPPPRTPAAAVKPKRRNWAPILLPIVTGAAVIGAVATRHDIGFTLPPQPGASTPSPRPGGGITATPRRADAPDEPAGNMRAALDRVIAELTVSGRRTDFDPFLSLRPPSEIIAQATTPEALLRYGVAKLDQRDPAGADRLFEEATRPRFGPSQNRPYAPAFIARGLLYDPSIQHDLIMPMPNANFAETLYRRAIASGDTDIATAATRHLQRLTTWQAQRNR